MSMAAITSNKRSGDCYRRPRRRRRRRQMNPDPGSAGESALNVIDLFITIAFTCGPQGAPRDRPRGARPPLVPRPSFPFIYFASTFSGAGTRRNGPENVKHPRKGTPPALQDVPSFCADVPSAYRPTVAGTCPRHAGTCRRSIAGTCPRHAGTCPVLRGPALGPAGPSARGLTA